MTREIALHCMKAYSELHSDLCELCPIYGQTGSDHCFEDAMQYVIGMLEHNPIFDKIRAEMEDILIINQDEERIYQQIKAIIDKHMAESEEQDMTLDEAIKHAEEVAEEQEKLYRLCPASESENHCDGTKDCKTLENGKNKGCLKCAKEHRQLAEWLKELKNARETLKAMYGKIGYP